MKFVKLLTSAYVNGALRHPHEGVLHLEDDEAKRIIDGGLASDVSDDFSSKQDKETPAENISVENGGAAAPAEGADHPHQSEVAPAAADVEKPVARKAPASKE